MVKVSLSLQRKSLGFTLVELLVVLVLLAVAASVTAPNMVGFYHSSKQAALTRDVIAKLGQARTAAIETGQAADFLFSYKKQAFGTVSSTKIVPSGFVVDMVSALETTYDHEWSVIRFYPDGSSSGGTLDISSEHTPVVKHVRVDWLLGHIELQKETPDGF